MKAIVISIIPVNFAWPSDNDTNGLSVGFPFRFSRKCFRLEWSGFSYYIFSSSTFYWLRTKHSMRNATHVLQAPCGWINSLFHQMAYELSYNKKENEMLICLTDSNIREIHVVRLLHTHLRNTFQDLQRIMTIGEWKWNQRCRFPSWKSQRAKWHRKVVLCHNFNIAKKISLWELKVQNGELKLFVFH